MNANKLNHEFGSLILRKIYLYNEDRDQSQPSKRSTAIGRGLRL